MGGEEEPKREKRTIALSLTMSTQTTITPHNQQPYVSRTYPLPADLDATIQKAAAAQKEWAAVPLEKRIAIGRQFTVSPLS